MTAARDRPGGRPGATRSLRDVPALPPHVSRAALERVADGLRAWYRRPDATARASPRWCSVIARRSWPSRRCSGSPAVAFDHEQRSRASASGRRSSRARSAVVLIVSASVRLPHHRRRGRTSGSSAACSSTSWSPRCSCSHKEQLAGVIGLVSIVIWMMVRSAIRAERERALAGGGRVAAPRRRGDTASPAPNPAS